MSWLEIETKTLPPEVLGALTIKTDFTLAQKIILKNLHLNVQDAKMQGDFSWESQKNGPLVTLDLTTPKIENVMKLLGSKNPKPLGMGKLQGKIQYNPTSLHLTQLKGHLGSNFNFAGDVTIKHGGIKPKINAVLSLKSLNVNTLLASHQINSYPEAKVFLVSKKDVPSSSKWSNDPLDFTILNKFDGNFQITADQLTYKDIAISNPKLTAVIENGLLTVSSLTGSIFEGSFVSMGHLSSKNDIKIHMTLKDANLKGLPTQGSNVKIVAGKLFVSTNLTSRGKNMQALVQNLTGPLRISAKNGVINGFSLQELSQRLGDLKNPASLLGLLNTSMGKGQTPFSSFLSEITFNQGVGTIQSMSLEAQGGRGHASGQINLPQYALNIHAEFRLTDHPKIPPFHMKLTGPIDNPSRTLDTANLQQYMIENVFKGLIGNLGKGKLNPRDVLGSILGGSNAPPQQPQKSSPPSKPEAIVKDIFKGIF